VRKNVNTKSSFFLSLPLLQKIALQKSAFEQGKIKRVSHAKNARDTPQF
jgi:hypothetical protein